MKKTLSQSLVDYDQALLQALAETRGALLSSNHRLSAAEELAAQLATPASLAIVLAELSTQDTEPLAALQAAGGWMEAPRFARQFGRIRFFGPARLDREQPWRSPANRAETLWYRGLIFKGFRQTHAGVVEVVYIPQDILSLLPKLPSAHVASGRSGGVIDLQPAEPPPGAQPANADLVEDVFGLLVIVRNNKVRLKADGSLRPKDLQTLNAMCVSPLPPANVAHDQRLDLIVRLCHAAELVTVDQDVLALKSNAARTWLQATAGDRLLTLQIAWRDDPNWNDLWHIPTLKPQPTGWKNDPVLTRHQVLGILADCHPGQWYQMNDLVHAVKESHADFQRPDGDYTAWYIQDRLGQPLMGFEHWDDVEGALLRFLIAGPLHWLGVTDLGYAAEPDHPVAFRLSDAGLRLLLPVAVGDEDSRHARGEELEISIHDPGDANVADSRPRQSGTGPGSPSMAVPALTLRDDFVVQVGLGNSLYTRFQLFRFADFIGRDKDCISFRMSPASLARARRQGITQAQINAFLVQGSGRRAPHTLLETLRNWHEWSGSVWLEQGVILRVVRPETLRMLQTDPQIAPLLGEVLGPRAMLVPRSNVEKVRRWLFKQGYLKSG